MLTLYRVAKTTRPVFDTSGAYLQGGRWNSPGRHVIYASTCLAGSLLEILAHAGRRLKIPGKHRCARGTIPEQVEVEVLEEELLAGWDAEESEVARTYGDDWLRDNRTAVISVPSVIARPYGRNLLLNPAHPQFSQIRFERPAPIVWDARLFS
jgi:RES domain-containing protein